MVASASCGLLLDKLGDGWSGYGGYEQISLQKECTRFPTQSELTIVLIPY
jgi:hypothetical protein